MPRIILDFEPRQPEAPTFEGDTSELVYFLSWAFSQRYGASHEMAEAAHVMRTQYKVDMTPLLTFADREVEEPGDLEVLDRSWQDAGPLAECCARVGEILRGDDPRMRDLMETYPALAGNIEELGRIAAWAQERDARIRVTYELGGS